MKKKYIIYFLSAILMLMICSHNVKADTINVNDYEYKGYQIPDVRDIPVFDDYDNYIILFNNNNHVFYTLLFDYVNPYIVSTSIFCSYDDFPIAISSTCKSINGGGRAIGTSYRVYYYFYNGQWVQDGSLTNSLLYIQHWYDLVYTSINLHIGDYNSSSTFPSGFLVNVSPVVVFPSFSVNVNDYYYNSSNSLVHRYVFDVNNYSNDFFYEYRLQSFDDPHFLNDWSNLDLIRVSDEFDDDVIFAELLSSSNIRYWLRIRNKSDNSVVFEHSYVVAIFLDDNYTQYYFNDNDVYYYISGFHNISPISNNVLLTLNGSFTAWDISYYDFTDNIVIDYHVTTDSCVINGISYYNCFSYNINNIPNYNSSHVYGLRLKNNFAISCPDGTYCGSILVHSHDDRDFFVLNSLFVSSSGTFNSSSGLVTDNDIDFIDNSDNIVSSVSYDFDISDFTSFSNTLTGSASNYTSVFTLFGSSISTFINNLNLPLLVCWLFCFSLFIFAICIKIWF